MAFFAFKMRNQAKFRFDFDLQIRSLWSRFQKYPIIW